MIIRYRNSGKISFLQIRISISGIFRLILFLHSYIQMSEIIYKVSFLYCYGCGSVGFVIYAVLSAVIIICIADFRCRSVDRHIFGIFCHYFSCSVCNDCCYFYIIAVMFSAVDRE